ncbi:MAG TPA: peptide-methionine (S)-S-oxide reductase MsrA [Bacteroidales bacterium]|nr:peptide-methionine (S)-S-oxide reductase MsrA [Bacteroidales bacterium]
MKILKTNKTTFLLILFQIIAIFTMLLSACGATTNKKKQMENKSKFTSINSETGQAGNPSSFDTITLGGGCFWCVEAVYEMLDGVVKVESGYSGGTVKNPTYKEVCTGLTGHAEVAQITFDKSKTSVEEILKVFFTVHDPTSLNRQGADVGTQYRSVIFYRNNNQRDIAKNIIDDLNNEHVYATPIVTQLVPFTNFYKAEDYHQDYYNQNKEAPYCKLVIQPKLEKFEKVFKDRLKK